MTIRAETTVLNVRLSMVTPTIRGREKEWMDQAAAETYSAQVRLSMVTPTIRGREKDRMGQATRRPEKNRSLLTFAFVALPFLYLRWLLP